MELFSKRYSGGSQYRLRRYIRFPDRPDSRKGFLKEELRKRLRGEIKYLVNSGNFVEPFLTARASNGGYYLHKETLENFSATQLGYDLTENINCRTIDFQSEEYNDAHFFDLIEILIIFCRDEKRGEFIKRIQNIFDEEGNDFAIHGFMIISREETSLSSIISLVKSPQMKKRLEEYYETRHQGDYQVRAQLSSRLLQYVFSSPNGQEQTKTFSENLCRQVASKWTDADNVDSVADLIGDLVKNAKKLNNKVSDIRHTDAHTIPVESPDFYKLIAASNIHLVELVVLSLPEEYIARQDPTEMKLGYAKNYQIDLSKQNLESTSSGEDIRIEDIPF